METVFPGVELWQGDVPPVDGDSFSVFCCLMGQLRYGELRLCPGDVVLQPGVSEHLLTVPDGASCGTMRFLLPDADRSVRIWTQMLLGQTLSLETLLNRYGTEPSILRASNVLHQFFLSLEQVQGELRAGFLRLKVLELLLLLQCEDEQVLPVVRRSEQTALMETVRTYLLEHLSQRISVETLSRRFHMSQTALKHSFRETFGIPIGTYMRRRRLETACRLLTETDDSIAEIVRMVGYENPGRFSVTFRQVTGMTPSAYRAQGKKLVLKNCTKTTRLDGENPQKMESFQQNG